LTGGAAEAPPVPLDEDGIPTLTADLTETTSIRDTLHNVDRVLVDNQDVMKDALTSFESYTASLADKGDAIDSVLRQADTAFAGFDAAIAKVDNIVPGLANGKDGELFQKVKSIRELAESFDSAIAKIDEFVPGLANGKEGELYQKVKSIRELAESFNKRSAAFMEEGRRTLLDISEGAHKMDRKFEPDAGVAPGAGPKRP